MKDSILRVIDDLETKREAFELIETRSQGKNDDYSRLERMTYAGATRSLKYAIKELRKVLDENPKV